MNVNIQSVEGATPLFAACGNGHKDIAKMLLDKQADINIQNFLRIYAPVLCMSEGP
jgi:ankyrin repeat protein